MEISVTLFLMQAFHSKSIKLSDVLADINGTKLNGRMEIIMSYTLERDEMDESCTSSIDAYVIFFIKSNKLIA